MHLYVSNKPWWTVHDLNLLLTKINKIQLQNSRPIIKYLLYGSKIVLFNSFKKNIAYTYSNIIYFKDWMLEAIATGDVVDIVLPTYHRPFRHLMTWEQTLFVDCPFQAFVRRRDKQGNLHQEQYIANLNYVAFCRFDRASIPFLGTRPEIVTSVAPQFHFDKKRMNWDLTTKIITTSSSSSSSAGEREGEVINFNLPALITDDSDADLQTLTPAELLFRSALATVVHQYVTDQTAANLAQKIVVNPGAAHHVIRHLGRIFREQRWIGLAGSSDDEENDDVDNDLVCNQYGLLPREMVQHKFTFKINSQLIHPRGVIVGSSIF